MARVLLGKEGTKYVDVLLLVLLHSDEYSLLPELYDVFGEASLLKFLDVFAGSTITIPSQEKLATCARDVDMYVRSKRATSSEQHGEVLRQLAEHYDVTVRAVEKVVERMTGVVEKTMSLDSIFNDLERKVLGGRDNG